MNINKKFSEFIFEATKACQSVTNPAEKAMAFAEIAKAIAMTGLVDFRNSEIIENFEDKKESLKNKPNSKKKEVEEIKDPEEEPKEVDQESVEEAESQEEIEYESESEEEEKNTWDDDSIKKYSAEVEYIKKIAKQKTPKVINAHIVEYSHGAIKSASEVSPSNIKGIYCYLKSLYSSEKE